MFRKLLYFCSFTFLIYLVRPVHGSARQYDRLPNDTKPISYDIHLITNVHNSEVNYSGTVQIRLLAVSETNKIVIHAKNLSDIKLSLIELETKKEFDGLEYNIDEEKEQMVLTSSMGDLNLVSGQEYLLTISYKANLRKGKGFSLMYYNDSDGNSIPMAASHLSKGFTRTVFPCYDEPALKAKFTISLTHANNYTAYSNMPAIGEPVQSGEGYVTTKFMETPPMSTYIIAFAIANYSTTSESVGNTTVRLLSPPNAKGGQLSFEVAKQVLPIMNEYFEIAYPLPKLDHFSVPNLAARGMENWGLIIYPETVLLQDSGSNFDTMLNINTVVHEMAHNWFGNLVTPTWWSYYWLSEGITSFYGPKFVNMIKPEWNHMEYFILRRFGGVTWDYPDHCSLTCNAKTAEEFYTTFGAQSYGKGAFFMRMFENALTENVFRRGIIKYLKTYQFSSATEDDLFTCLQEAVYESTIPFFREEGSLVQAMKSWTSQKFYPLVTVTRNYEEKTFKVEQNNYKDRSPENTDMWWIPVSFTTASSCDFENSTVDFIIPGQKTMKVNPIEFNKTLLDTDWLILNKEQFGMYRVNYDEKNWQLITCALIQDPQSIPRYTKAQILRDIISLFQDGFVSEEILRNAFLYLKNEKDPLPWDEAHQILNSFHSDLKGHETLPIFETFVADMIESVFDEIGMEPKENETPSTELLRLQILNLACSVGLDKCVKSAEHLSELALSGNAKISSFMLTHIYCLSVKYGGEDYFDNLLKKSIENKDDNILTNALTCSEDKGKLRELLASAIEMESFESIFSRLIDQSTGLSLILEMAQNKELDSYKNFKEETKRLIYFAETTEQRDQIIKICEDLGHVISNETLEEIESSINNRLERQNTISKIFVNQETLLSSRCSV